MLRTVSSALEKAVGWSSGRSNRCQANYLWANEDRMGQNLLTRGAFGGEASMHDICTLEQSG